MIFDTHAHYDDEAFDEDRDELLSSMAAQGIAKIVNIGSSFEANQKTPGVCHFVNQIIPYLARFSLLFLRFYDIIFV